MWLDLQGVVGDGWLCALCAPGARAEGGGLFRGGGGRRLGGCGAMLLRAVEALAATTATVGHQSHDPHDAIQKALWHGAAHIHPTAHRTARALPAPALSRGVFHALLSVTSRTNGRG